MATKFYKCARCGNVIVKMVDSGVPVVCCGEQMKELMANTVEASVEKHLPHVTQCADGMLKIEIGSEHHPMSKEHNILSHVSRYLSFPVRDSDGTKMKVYLLLLS